MKKTENDRVKPGLIRMRIITFILFILLFSFGREIYCQNSSFIKTRSFKNPENIESCIIKNDLSHDTLNLILHISTNSADTVHDYKLIGDSIFNIFYGAQQFPIDSFVKFDSVQNKNVLFYTSKVSMSYYDKKQGYIFNYRLYSGKKPKILTFNGIELKTCPSKPISYALHNNDTINLISANGYMDGKWIEFYQNGKVRIEKTYSKGVFIEGFEFDLDGRKISKFFENGCSSYSIPLDD